MNEYLELEDQPFETNRSRETCQASKTRCTTSKSRGKKILKNIFFWAIIITIILYALVGVVTTATVIWGSMRGYSIVVVNPNEASSLEPDPVLMNSPNNQYHLLLLENEGEFWKNVEEIYRNPNKELLYYSIIPFQKVDGTWGNHYIISYNM